MKKWKNIMGCSCMILAVVCASQGVYASYSSTVEVVNHVETGDVNIDLTEYEILNGAETTYDPEKTGIIPGDTISKIPRISNLAEDCYVRCKIDYVNPDETTSDNEGEFPDQSEEDPMLLKSAEDMPDSEEELPENPEMGEEKNTPLDDTCLLEVSEEWKKIGNYYYYLPILRATESIDLFQGIQIPDNWTENWAAKAFSVNIQAEAVQADYFRPDYDSADPWFGTEVETCVHDVNGVTEQVEKTREGISVRFDGSAHKLLAAPEDFFVNFGRLMPGESVEDYFAVENLSGNALRLYFHTELPEDITEEEKELLSKLQLQIMQGEKELYAGDLTAVSLQDPLMLGEYNAKGTDNITFTVMMPAELKNAYAMRAADVVWVFSAEEIEPIPQTGDMVQILMYFVLAIISFAGGIALFKMKPKDTKKL